MKNGQQIKKVKLLRGWKIGLQRKRWGWGEMHWCGTEGDQIRGRGRE